MTNLYTFGCSWTAGTIPDFHSWSRELAIIRPDITVKDYSQGGTSVKWSVSQLYRLRNQIKDGISVFQITSPGRVTYVNQNINYDKLRIHRIKNYYNFVSHTCHEMLCFNANYKLTNNIYYDKNQIDFLHELTYDSLDLELEMLEWKMYIDYAAWGSNFIYFQNSGDLKTYELLGGSKMPAVDNYFSKKQLSGWTIDNGGHLDKEGSGEIAKWVMKNLNL